jgi:hypothetical protein
MANSLWGEISSNLEMKFSLPTGAAPYDKLVPSFGQMTQPAVYGDNVLLGDNISFFPSNQNPFPLQVIKERQNLNHSTIW